MIPSLTPPRPILYILLAEDCVFAVGEDPLRTMRAGLDHIDQRAHNVEDPWSDKTIRETLTNLTLIIHVALPVILRLEQDDAPPATREEMAWHADGALWVRRYTLVRNGVLLSYVEFIDPPTGGGR